MGDRGQRNLPSSLIICYSHIHHILTFQTSRDTWRVAFYLNLIDKCKNASMMTRVAQLIRTAAQFK